MIHTHEVFKKNIGNTETNFRDMKTRNIQFIRHTQMHLICLMDECLKWCDRMKESLAAGLCCYRSIHWNANECMFMIQTTLFSNNMNACTSFGGPVSNEKEIKAPKVAFSPEVYLCWFHIPLFLKLSSPPNYSAGYKVWKRLCYIKHMEVLVMHRIYDHMYIHYVYV